MEDGSYPHPDISPVECVMDARSALRWMKENADSLHIDPKKIAAAGQSAGGQLALSTGLIACWEREEMKFGLSLPITI
jgi:acetyl esterase